MWSWIGAHGHAHTHCVKECMPSVVQTVYLNEVKYIPIYFFSSLCKFVLWLKLVFWLFSQVKLFMCAAVCVCVNFSCYTVSCVRVKYLLCAHINFESVCGCVCVCVCEGQFVLFFPYFSTSERAFLELLSPVQTKMAEREGWRGGGSGRVCVCVSVCLCVYARVCLWFFK